MIMSFGAAIRQARMSKGLSQRQLAKEIQLDFTYLSKLENDRSEYMPKEAVIQAIATCLDLNGDELMYLAGKIPQTQIKLLQQHYQLMPQIFEQLQQNPQQLKQYLQDGAVSKKSP